MIIESFAVTCTTAGGETVFALDTVFGFFPTGRVRGAARPAADTSGAWPDWASPATVRIDLATADSATDGTEL